MESTILSFRVDEQNLVKTAGVDKLASDTVNYVEAQFSLGANWQDFDSVRAIWTGKGNVSLPTVLDSEGNCEVPHTIVAEMCEVHVNLVGSVVVGGELVDRLTSFPILAVIVTKNALVDGEEEPITPSQFEQFVAYVKADADRAEDARDDAELAQQRAEDAQALAEQAVTDAQTAQHSAEQAVTDAQTAQHNAEQAVTDAQTAKRGAELAEDGAEANALKAEGYAVGEQNGEEVPSTSPYYEHNAKYFADLAKEYRDEINTLSITAHELPAGDPPTASIVDGLITLGIPAGAKGEDGNVLYATFYVDNNMVLHMYTPDGYTSPMFALVENKLVLRLAR